jgi:hypothetical protein
MEKESGIHHYSCNIDRRGGWFGISKYLHGLHHEETDDAQVCTSSRHLVLPVM